MGAVIMMLPRPPRPRDCYNPMIGVEAIKDGSTQPTRLASFSSCWRCIISFWFCAFWRERNGKRWVSNMLGILDISPNEYVSPLFPFLRCEILLHSYYQDLHDLKIAIHRTSVEAIEFVALNSPASPPWVRVAALSSHSRFVRSERKW